MQSRLRLVIAGALVALTVAACGSSAASGSAAPSAPAPSPSASPSAAAPSESPAASVPAASASAAPSAAASVAPSGTPTPQEQALIDLLPTKVGSLTLKGAAVDVQGLIASAPENNKGLVDFLTSIGLTTSDLLIAYAAPTAATNFPFSVSAYRFIGADPATLKDKFISANLGSQTGATAKEQQIGGRTVTALLAPAGDTTPPVYLIFKGDTVFVASSTDAATAADIVKAMPQ